MKLIKRRVKQIQYFNYKLNLSDTIFQSSYESNRIVEELRKSSIFAGCCSFHFS